MTSVLSEEESKVAKMKQKLMNNVHAKEETRSFLSFSRENLSISQSDIEQGFNKHRFRPNRNTILSVTALIIALLCLGLESWKFHCSLVNAREIEELKRSVESLKHRFLEEDLLDELKAFEEQLYAEVSNDDDDPDEADIDNADYDSIYDDESYSSHDYSTDYHRSHPAFGARPSDFPDSSSTIAPVPSPPEPTAGKAMMELLAAVRKSEAKHGQELKINENNADLERDQKDKVLEVRLENHKNSTSNKMKRDASGRENAKDIVLDWKTTLIEKRSIGEEHRGSKKLPVNRHVGRNQTRRTIGFGSDSDSDSNSNSKESFEGKQNTSVVVSGRHPPKKYYTHTSVDSPSSRKDKTNAQSIANRPRKLSRKLRKHLRVSRQIFAVHYDGDKYGFSMKDEHTGNGRIRHGDSVFKAWKPSDWVNDLGMSDHFRMASDGSVTVYESGLYLVYAQIHYHDAHAEVGFHLQVNNQPILQCMIDNSGNSRNISQTCFSAQLTLFQKEDVLVFKEIGSSRYAIFDKEKSFFGLVKLGEIKRPSQLIV